VHNHQIPIYPSCLRSEDVVIIYRFCALAEAAEAFDNLTLLLFSTYVLLISFFPFLRLIFYFCARSLSGNFSPSRARF